jgi:hypothetical protein
MRALLIALVAGVCAAAATAQPQAGDRATFEQMCARVSSADGVPAEAVAPFCSCLGGRAAQSAELYTELSNAAQSEPNADRRMQMLSSAAREAVQACRGPQGAGGDADAW